jgi:hypothetical protein
LVGKIDRQGIFLVQDPEHPLNDYARALAEELVKGFDYLIEPVWHLIFSDSSALENPIDFVPNSTSQQPF